MPALRAWLGARLPGAAARRAQVAAFASEWEGANEEAQAVEGPLWVALGDSATQGIGASSRDTGWVLRLLDLLRAQRNPGWRVVNLARSGALLGDVLAEQLPRLEALPAPQLVTCAAGANDLLRTRPAGMESGLREVLGRLPAGAVVATLPQGLRASRARAMNTVLVATAAERRLVVADVWSRTGPPWQHKFAADHFHPNDLGYGDWLAAFAEALGLDPDPAPSR